MKRRWRFLALAGLTVTCARPGPAREARAEAAPSPVTMRGKPSPSTVKSATPLTPAPVAAGPLAGFFAALRTLEAHTRQEHVRVLWLGDSHTNADFLSGAVRSELQARFGDGGPGFVRIGTKPYRHDGIKIARAGKWNIDPDPPARRSLQDDGVFGLGGTRAAPGSGALFSAQAVAAEGAASVPAQFELAYTLPPGAFFRLELGGKALRVDAGAASEQSASGIAHLTLTAPYGSTLALTPAAGEPRLFHIVIERRDAPGVVLDAAGIDGARLETALAWNEAAFIAEAARRRPELFVVAYGTNESFDATRVEKYGPQLAKLVGRLRRAAPGASCLVLGPTDAPLGEGSVPRVGEVTAALREAAAPLGCSFVSLQQLMGGEGSFARGMKAKERLGQPDKLHLTPKGYRELGGALSKLVLDAYFAGRADL